MRLVVAALALVGAWRGSAHATTYYVRASGDESNDGLTPDTARASVRATGRRLRQPGDRLIVGPGTYHEGNIQPHGSGTPDAPIVLLGDTTGSLTGDPPGRVLILPPNRGDSSAGFTIFGQHDIHIEGFTIHDAEGAGIHVSPERSSGIDSARISIANNWATGCRIGIKVIAIGDIGITGNYLTGNRTGGLALVHGLAGILHPLVTGNVIEENDGVGLLLNGESGGSISGNHFDANRRDLQLGDTDGLAITANEILGGRVGKYFGANLEITDNLMEGGAVFGPTVGRFVFARNKIPSGTFLIAGGSAHNQVIDNQLGQLYVTGGGPLELKRNTGFGLDAKDLGDVTATDNRFQSLMRIRAAGMVEVSHNEADYLGARGSEVLLVENSVAELAVVRAQVATVRGNRTGALDVVEVHTLPPRPDGSGGYLVSGNVSQGPMLVGERTADRAVVENNVAGGVLRVAARRELNVHRNNAQGINCLLFAPDSRLVLAENASHDGKGAGLTVIGAGNAMIQNNASSNSADSGLAVRRTQDVVISGNDFLNNQQGGISIRAPLAGDCNRDLRVTIDEIVTAISIDLDQRPLADCRAADLDGDGRVGVQEIVLAVADALSPPDLHDSSTAIDSNRVEHNGRFGIDAFAVGTVWAADNRVIENAGIPLAIYSGFMADAVEVVDNVLGLGGAQGLLLDGVAQASVRNNVIFSNREAGVLLRDAPGTAVVNNLVYANGDNGIAVGLGGALPTVGTSLANNTVYGNAGWGIAIGSAAAPSTGTVIHDNIVQGNGRGGIAASTAALLGPMLGFNLNDDRNGNGVPTADSDFSADPQFVAPAGPDGILGGTGYADDDFHLQPTSPAIDAGSAPAAALGITGSAVAGKDVDEGIVDLGYHYGALP